MRKFAFAALVILALFTTNIVIASVHPTDEVSKIEFVGANEGDCALRITFNTNKLGYGEGYLLVPFEETFSMSLSEVGVGSKQTDEVVDTSLTVPIGEKAILFWASGRELSRAYLRCEAHGDGLVCEKKESLKYWQDRYRGNFFLVRKRSAAAQLETGSWFNTDSVDIKNQTTGLNAAVITEDEVAKSKDKWERQLVSEVPGQPIGYFILQMESCQTAPPTPGDAK